MAIISGADRHIAPEFKWQVWFIQPTAGELTGVVDIAVTTLPKGTVILDAKMGCVQGDVGATASTVDMEIGVGGVELLTGGADLLGDISIENSLLESELDAAITVTIAGDTVLNAEVTYTGTATTGPKFFFALLAGRADVPT